MEKFFKNPMYMGIATVATLAIVVLVLWDSHKNPKKDFFGLLKSDEPAV